MSPSRTNEPGGAKAVPFPPCLFPALNYNQKLLLPRAQEPPSVFGVVSEARFLAPGVGGARESVGLPTVCKAAWMLTLQCFVQTDILCFAYQKAATGSEHATDPILYFARANGDEEVESFLRRLDKSPRSSAAVVPLGHAIWAVEGQSAVGDFCNTILCCRERDNGAELRAHRPVAWTQSNVPYPRRPCKAPFSLLN